MGVAKTMISHEWICRVCHCRGSARSGASSSADLARHRRTNLHRLWLAFAIKTGEKGVKTATEIA